MSHVVFSCMLFSFIVTCSLMRISFYFFSCLNLISAAKSQYNLEGWPSVKFRIQTSALRWLASISGRISEHRFPFSTTGHLLYRICVSLCLLNISFLLHCVGDPNFALHILRSLFDIYLDSFSLVVIRCGIHESPWYIAIP